jgi:hypothetical protein
MKVDVTVETGRDINQIISTREEAVAFIPMIVLDTINMGTSAFSITDTTSIVTVVKERKSMSVTGRGTRSETATETGTERKTLTDILTALRMRNAILVAGTRTRSLTKNLELGGKKRL